MKRETVYDFPPATPQGKAVFDIAMVVSEDGQSFYCVRPGGRKYTAKRVGEPKK